MNSNSVDNSLLGIPLFSSFLSSLFIIISVRWEVKIQCRRSRINNLSPRGGSYGSKAREQCTCHGNTRQYHSGACTVTHIDYHVDSDTFVSTSIFQAICGLRGETSGAWAGHGWMPSPTVMLSGMLYHQIPITPTFPASVIPCVPCAPQLYHPVCHSNKGRKTRGHY